MSTYLDLEDRLLAICERTNQLKEKAEIYGEIEEIESLLSTLDNTWLKDRYDEMLDEVYGEISICGHNYQASTTLKEVDPIAYSVGMNDYESSLSQDGDLFIYDDQIYQVRDVEKLLEELEAISALSDDELLAELGVGEVSDE